jgi:quercetin dioxygenase-like cupin family protein
MCGSSTSTKNQYNFSDCVVPFIADNTSATDAGWMFWFYHADATESGLNLKMSYVDKETAMHPPHKHFDKEIFYILEGDAEVYLEGETRIIGANSSFFCPSNLMHGIKRASDKPLKYLVIRGGKKSDITTSQKGDFTLDNCVTTFSKENVQITESGWSFWFAPKELTEGLNLKMTYVDKLIGAFGIHQHSNDEMIYLLEGQGEVIIDGNKKIIQPNTALYYPGNTLHCFQRASLQQPIRYIVINQ